MDLGVQGRECDAGVFLNTDLCGALVQNTLRILEKRCLPGRDVNMPYLIAADDAFALSELILKPL